MRAFQVRHGYVLVTLLFAALATQPARADFLKEIGSAVNKAGAEIAQGIDKASQDLGTSGQKQSVAAADVKLPGGVASRLKKIDSELDKAEKSLSAGAGTDVDRATRAKQNLKRAEGYKKEIETRYKGQYSDDHPDVAATFGRLAALEKRVQSAGQSAEAAEESKRQAQAAEEAAAAKAAADREAAEKAQKDAAAAAAQRNEEQCQAWDKRLRVYTEGDKALYACIGANDAAMPRCEGIYDEAVALVQGFDKSPMAANPCGAVNSTRSELSRFMDNFKDSHAIYAKKHAEAAANLGEIVFATSPIDPANPSGLTRQFHAGDNIYGLIKTTKPWSAIYRNQNNASVMVNVQIDGKKIHAQFVNLKKPALLQQQYLRFDIAPEPGKMTAYSDPDIEYGKSTATTRQGPNELTSHLGALGPGRHTLTFDVQYYGTTWAAGEFTVEGKRFDSYASLHNKIAAAVSKTVTLPAAKMINKSMQAEMKALLENAGWKDIRRINIVDKDWWLDRVSGGDSPIKSRHLAAAALARDGNGSWYYKTCTFHQDKLITGGFGKLYLSHQGDKVPVPDENIDK